MKFNNLINFYKKMHLSQHELIALYLEFKERAFTKINLLNTKYPRKIAERAFQKYTQKKIKKSPTLMLPSEAGLAFYFKLNLKTQDILTEYGRSDLKKNLEYFALTPQDHMLALQFLDKARTPKIRSLLQPGKLADYLDSKNFFKK